MLAVAAPQVRPVTPPSTAAVEAPATAAVERPGEVGFSSLDTGDFRQAGSATPAAATPATAAAAVNEHPTVVRPDAIKVSPEYRTRQVPSDEPPNINTTYHPEHDLRVSISVEDARLRDQFPGFDGLEQPFVMVPSERDGQVTWSRHELQYTGTGRDGLFMEKVVDRYALPPLRDVDLAAIQKYGVAVGFETNLGTLWGQAPDQNFQAKEYSGLGF